MWRLTSSLRLPVSWSWTTRPESTRRPADDHSKVGVGRPHTQHVKRASEPSATWTSSNGRSTVGACNNSDIIHLTSALRCRMFAVKRASIEPQHVRDSDIPPWTYSPGHNPPKQFPCTIPLPFYTMQDISSFHHHHPPINYIKRSRLTCTKLIEVDQLGLGVRVSVSFQIFALIIKIYNNVAALRGHMLFGGIFQGVFSWIPECWVFVAINCCFISSIFIRSPKIHLMCHPLRMDVLVL